jgi:hypothetical protein
MKFKAVLARFLMVLRLSNERYKAAFGRSLLVPVTFVAALLIGFGLLAITQRAPVRSLTLFPTEQQARLHCPRDMVVWLNLRSGVYHIKGQQYYGVAGDPDGTAYTCRKEADQTGNRISNGEY